MKTALNELKPTTVKSYKRDINLYKRQLAEIEAGRTFRSAKYVRWLKTAIEKLEAKVGIGEAKEKYHDRA